MRHKWLIASLVASLAVNLALAGFVVGRLTLPGAVPATLDPSLSMFRVLRQLPEPRRDELRPIVRAHFVGLRGDLRRMREAQDHINAALATHPFDAAALNGALEGFRQALMDSQQANHRVLVRVAGDMTPAERELLREAMTRPPRHGPPRGRDHREESR
jgi:uncharacterized membrane protein